MAFFAEEHLAEGQFPLLKSTRNELKSLNLRFRTRNSTVSKSVGQNFEHF